MRGVVGVGVGLVPGAERGGRRGRLATRRRRRNRRRRPNFFGRRRFLAAREAARRRGERGGRGVRAFRIRRRDVQETHATANRAVAFANGRAERAEVRRSRGGEPRADRADRPERRAGPGPGRSRAARAAVFGEHLHFGDAQVGVGERLDARLDLGDARTTQCASPARQERAHHGLDGAISPRRLGETRGAVAHEHASQRARQRPRLRRDFAFEAVDAQQIAFRGEQRANTSGEELGGARVDELGGCERAPPRGDVHEQRLGGAGQLELFVREGAIRLAQPRRRRPLRGGKLGRRVLHKGFHHAVHLHAIPQRGRSRLRGLVRPRVRPRRPERAVPAVPALDALRALRARRARARGVLGRAVVERLGADRGEPR